MGWQGAGSMLPLQQGTATDILTELLFIDNYRIYIGGPITGRLLFYRHTEPTEQRVQNQACLSYAETRWRKTKVKARNRQK